MTALAMHEPLAWLDSLRGREQRRQFRAAWDRAMHQSAEFRSTLTADSTTDLWRDFNKKIDALILASPPLSFLRDPTISATMVMTREGELLREELSYLRSHVDDNLLRDVLREDPIGRPRICSAKFRTSHNTVHHAYHLARFMESCGANLADMHTIVEWGGGYGNMAKLIWRFAGTALNYTVIDTPSLCILQYAYLCATIGADHVNLITERTSKVRAGSINIVPVQWHDSMANDADLFVSTWALSESPRVFQDRVAVDHRWFGARHILLGYQESSPVLQDAAHAGAMAASEGASIEDLPVLKGQHYAFR